MLKRSQSVQKTTLPIDVIVCWWMANRQPHLRLCRKEGCGNWAKRNKRLRNALFCKQHAEEEYHRLFPTENARDVKEMKSTAENPPKHEHRSPNVNRIQNMIMDVHDRHHAQNQARTRTPIPMYVSHQPPRPQQNHEQHLSVNQNDVGIDDASGNGRGMMLYQRRQEQRSMWDTPFLATSHHGNPYERLPYYDDYGENVEIIYRAAPPLQHRHHFPQYGMNNVAPIPRYRINAHHPFNNSTIVREVHVNPYSALEDDMWFRQQNNISNVPMSGIGIPAQHFNHGILDSSTRAAPDESTHSTVASANCSAQQLHDYENSPMATVKRQGMETQQNTNSFDNRKRPPETPEEKHPVDQRIISTTSTPNIWKHDQNNSTNVVTDTSTTPQKPIDNRKKAAVTDDLKVIVVDDSASVSLEGNIKQDGNETEQALRKKSVHLNQSLLFCVKKRIKGEN